MTAQVGQFVGLGGVAPDDNKLAHAWEKRLDGVMIAVALLSVLITFVDVQGDRRWVIALADSFHWFIFAAFSAELLWMLHVSSRKLVYLTRNWLNVVIIVIAILSLAGLTSGIWVASARLARLALVSLLVARALSGVGNALVARGVPLVFGLSTLMLLLAGIGFLLLEPTVHSFGEGLWLAFVTGATVGYGDIVPTTTASRIFAVLMVLVGFALLSMVTATISAFFIGEDEKRTRREMHTDVRELRKEVRALRDELGQLRKEKASRDRPG
jgi:voltage-gated potassium channel